MNGEGRWELIYDQINGLNVPGVCGWVKDESSPEGAVGPLVEQIYGARNRLCARTGLDPDTDPDFELLLSGVEGLSRTCGELMYHYGYRDGINAK